MLRRKLFQFRLTKKQKSRLVTFLALALCVWGGFLFFKHHAPVTPKTHAIHRPVSRRPEHRPVVTRPPRPTSLPVTLPVSLPAARIETRPAFRPAHPRIAFVIDDIGGHNKLTRELAALDPRATYAILPLLPFSRFFAEQGRQLHVDVILHLPLDTVLDKIPGPGLIVSNMPDEDIVDMLHRDLASVPYHIGANNHMGSKGTADRRVMKLILEEFKKENLFFLDSYTSKSSVVPEVAREVGVPYATRGSFLDNVDKKPAIMDAVKLLEATARKRGSAIAIGHYRKNTLDVLRTEIPRLEAEGFEIVRLKDLILKAKS